MHLFERFLAGPVREAGALYLLGDLFDAWPGDDILDDPSDVFHASLCASLQKVGASGTALYFLPGNRDFLVGPRFLAATGMQLLTDETIIDIAGTRTLLMHGDTLCTDDAEYQQFRQRVRGEQWRHDFMALPLAARRASIEQLRQHSEREKQAKSHAIMDVNAAAVAAALRRHGVTRLIHGHTHRRAHHPLAIDGSAAERWVLGDWDTSGNALACDANGCRWLEWPPSVSATTVGR